VKLSRVRFPPPPPLPDWRCCQPGQPCFVRAFEADQTAAVRSRETHGLAAPWWPHGRRGEQRFSRKLEIIGRRLPRRSPRAASCMVSAGYSHPIFFGRKIGFPRGITFSVAEQHPGDWFSGSNRVAGRSMKPPRSAPFRPPEPYQGKGIKFRGRAHPAQGRQIWQK